MSQPPARPSKQHPSIVRWAPDAHYLLSMHIHPSLHGGRVCVCVCLYVQSRSSTSPAQSGRNHKNMPPFLYFPFVTRTQSLFSMCTVAVAWPWFISTTSQPASLQARILPLIRPLDYPIPLLKPEQQRNIIVHVKHSCPVVQSKRNITVVYITFTTINDGNIAIPSLSYVHERLYCSGLRSCIAVIQVHCIHHHCLCDYRSPIGYLR